MQVTDEGGSLRWPDFSGNWMFNTLGGSCLWLVFLLYAWFCLQQAHTLALQCTLYMLLLLH